MTATATVKKNKKHQKVKTPEPVQTTKFKIWCIKHNLTQRQIKRDTKLSIGTIQATWSKGKANPSVIKLLSVIYGFDEEKLKKLISEFDTID